MSKKIAILFFGHLRTFKQTHPYTIKNLIEKYDCDIFIHTWDKIDSATLSWDNKEEFKEDFNKEVVDLVKTIYKPKKIKIEHQEKMEDKILTSLDGQRQISFNGIKFMFYSLSQANELRKEYEKEQNVNYDIILCTRPDIAIYNFLDIEKILHEAEILNFDINKTRFFASISRSSDFFLKSPIGQGNDMLFFGVKKVIDTYIETNTNLTYEYAQKHFIAVTTIFTSKEILAGLIPMPVHFLHGKDWKNIKFEEVGKDIRPKKTNKNKERSSLYKFLHLHWLRNKK